MSEKLYLCLREAHPNGLDMRLTEINSFNISIQKTKSKKIYNH